MGKSDEQYLLSLESGGGDCRQSRRRSRDRLDPDSGGVCRGGNGPRVGYDRRPGIGDQGDGLPRVSRPISDGVRARSLCSCRLVVGVEME